MNTRRLRGELGPLECKRCEHAWVEAARLDRPLNRMLTVRPGGKLGGWSRYHAGGFYCLLVREKERGGSEHFHVLIHVPRAKASLFDKTVRGWFDAHDDIDIRPAHQRVTAMRGGKRGSAIGYLTKQRTPQAAWKALYRRKPGDLVLGKRARISSTLRSYVPPMPIQVVKSVKPDISTVQSEAA